MFAAANTKLPDQLYREGLVERPVHFAANRLVVAVPARRRFASARSPTSTTPACGSQPGRQACRSAPTPARCCRGSGAQQALAIERNIRSNEPDVVGRRREGLAGSRGRRLRVRDGRARPPVGGCARSSCRRGFSQRSCTAVAVVKGTSHRQRGPRIRRGTGVRYRPAGAARRRASSRRRDQRHRAGDRSPRCSCARRPSRSASSRCPWRRSSSTSGRASCSRVSTTRSPWTRWC